MNIFSEKGGGENAFSVYFEHLRKDTAELACQYHNHSCTCATLEFFLASLHFQDWRCVLSPQERSSVSRCPGLRCRRRGRGHCSVLSGCCRRGALEDQLRRLMLSEGRSQAGQPSRPSARAGPPPTKLTGQAREDRVL